MIGSDRYRTHTCVGARTRAARCGWPDGCTGGAITAA